MDREKLATYAATLSDAQLARLYRRIAARTRLSDYGDWATYAMYYPAAYRALRTIAGENRARHIAARKGSN
jgi:hypothetical protein